MESVHWIIYTLIMVTNNCITEHFYTVSQKNCAKLFLSALRQISINFNNFWQVDDKMAEIIFVHFPPHLTHDTQWRN